MHLLMIGPVGSGKSTQSKIISEEIGLKLIQTGELVRQKALENSEAGRICKQSMEQGFLVSDEIMANLLREQLKQDLNQKGILLDSYPRRLSQLQVFDPGIDKVLYLKLPDNVLEERLMARKRQDDTKVIIENRLRVYHEETEPLLDFYHQQGKLITIDATGTQEEVTQKIKDQIPMLNF